MAQHKVVVNWQRRNSDFNYETFDRTCKISFGGGSQIEASNPPQYFGKAELPNPEELFISALASCYMQTFLAVACKQGFIIDNYTDNAFGIVGKNAQGRNCVTSITLKPRVKFNDAHRPNAETLNHLREKAHMHCFISNSINAQLTIDLQFSE